MKNEIIIFDNQNVRLKVNLKNETVWLSLEQISELFDRDQSVISRHIRNIFNDEELDSSVVANFATTALINKKIVAFFCPPSVHLLSTFCPLFCWV